MRNLLGRLHARSVPELLRVAAAWSVPLAAQSKGEIVSALYRTMSDPSAVRDVWSDLDTASRAMLLALAEAPDVEATPTLPELASRLGIDEASTRELAVSLYRAGILAREGDDEPLPIGAAPRLLLPRELATNIRRIQDEIAAGNLAQRPLRVLIELLEDAEIEEAATIWGWRSVPGVARREEIARRLLRLVSDPTRVSQVTRGLGRDAAAIWRAVRAASGPIALTDALVRSELAGSSPEVVARRRAALDDLETALLVWHTYSPDGARWLFVPEEIRHPSPPVAAALPPLLELDVAPDPAAPWRHPDAVAWDLLTVLRAIGNRQAPPWEAGAPPRWLLRTLSGRFWVKGQEGVPAGYLELLQALGLAEGVLSVNEGEHPHRIQPGPEARSWRTMTFPSQTSRLRNRWLRLPYWVEGASAELLDVWGADWKGFRPRLLHALTNPTTGLTIDAWVSLERLTERIARTYPALIGRTFVAANAQNDSGSDGDDESRTSLLREIVAIELSGPFCWFDLLERRDSPGKASAVRLTANALAAVSRQPAQLEVDRGAGEQEMSITPSGEIALLAPTPSRVWALGAIADLVGLGRVANYRLTSSSVASAVGAGIAPEQITTFLEQATRAPLPHSMTANIRVWADSARRVRLTRSVQLQCDDAAKAQALCRTLENDGWSLILLDARTVLVVLSGGARDEDALLAALRAAGIEPVWPGDAVADELSSAAPNGQPVRADTGSAA